MREDLLATLSCHLIFESGGASVSTNKRSECFSHHDNPVRRSTSLFKMSARDDGTVFNRNRKFRSRRRNKRRFGGNRSVDANKDPIEREDAAVGQNVTTPSNESQDETVSRP